MKHLSILLFIASMILAPSAGYCDAQTDLKLSDAIEKLKALKPDDVQFQGMTTEGGKVIVEGYAKNNVAIAGFLKTIGGNNIGTPGIREISPAEVEGRHVSHFIVWVKVVEIAAPPRPTVDELFPPSNEPLPFVTLHQEGELAWWHGAEFHPFGKEIRGIPIKSIDENWCAANEFKRGLFPKEVVEGDLGLKEIMGDEDAFSLEGKFDGEHKLTALVGVFETCGKDTATFLLVLDSNYRKKPVFSLIKYETPFFAYLLPDKEKNNGFMVLNCYACSEATLYRWNKSTREFDATDLGEGEGE